MLAVEGSAVFPQPLEEQLEQNGWMTASSMHEFHPRQWWG